MFECDECLKVFMYFKPPKDGVKCPQCGCTKITYDPAGIKRFSKSHRDDPDSPFKVFDGLKVYKDEGVK